VIGLDQCADGIAFAADLDDPRRGSRAALEFVTDHARAAANAALGDGTAHRALDRVEGMGFGHMLAVHIIEV